MGEFAIMARFEISLPPSANSAYINIPGRGRARSASHEKWKNSAGWEIQIQRVPKVAGHYAVRACNRRKGAMALQDWLFICDEGGEL